MTQFAPSYTSYSPEKPAAGLAQRATCLISLHESDKIRLLSLPTDIRPAFEQAISRGTYSVQSQGDYHGSYQYKLKGRPWWGQGDDAVRSRRLVVEIFRFMESCGWTLLLSADVSKKPYDKDTWFFRRRDVGNPLPIYTQFAAISFNRADLLRVIMAPPQVVEVITSTAQRCYPRGVQEIRHKDGFPQIKLRGYPWHATGGDTVLARQFLLEVIDALLRIGWTMYASCDISTGTSNEHVDDVDSWVIASV
ncbi:hypothetical protein HDU88_001012 [Geranomyces variabilis]|nr:hypothetical protein HDU88_001012 [Geranomyces variabilis]